MVFALGNFVLAGVSAVAFYLVGRAASSLFGFRMEGVAEKLASFTAFGMAFYALLFTGLGFAGLYQRPVAYVALLVGLVACLVKPRGLPGEVAETVQSFRSAALNFKPPIRFALVWSSFAVTVVTALVALVPQLWWDVLSYHLTLPLKYILTGGLYYVPDVRASSFPQYQEQINLFGMLLYSTRLAPLFVVLTWDVILVTVYAAGRRLYGRDAGLYGALVFLTTPFVLTLLPYAVNDHWWAMYFVVSVFFLIRWRENGHLRELAAAGVLAGVAFGSKVLQGFLLPVYLFAFIAAAPRGLKDVRRFSVALALFIVPFFALALPWFIRNYVYTGELLGFVADDFRQVSVWRGEIAPTGYFERFFWFLRLPTFRGPGSGLWDIVKMPVLLTVGRTTWGSSNGVGLLVYLGLFLSVFAKEKRRVSAVVLAGLLIYYVIWVFLMKATTPRYLYPALACAAVSAGAGYAWLLRAGARRLIIAVSVFALVLLGTLFLSRYTLYSYVRNVPLALSPGEHYQYVLDNLYGGEDLPAALGHLPPGSKVLSVDHKVFYLIGRRTPVYVGYPWNSYFFDYGRAKDPADMSARIRSRGFTHVLYREGDGDFLFPGSPWGADKRYDQYHFRYDFLEVYGVEVGGKDGDGVFGKDRLYELAGAPVKAPRPPSERTGEGFDYPLMSTPEAFKLK